jgi:hypothetical protein
MSITHPQQNKTNSVAFSPQGNYTDWLTATCRRNLVSTFVDRGVSRGQRCGTHPQQQYEINNEIECRGFWRRCISFRINRFLDCVYSQEIRIAINNISEAKSTPFFRWRKGGFCTVESIRSTEPHSLDTVFKRLFSCYLEFRTMGKDHNPIDKEVSQPKLMCNQWNDFTLQELTSDELHLGLSCRIKYIQLEN